MTPTAFLLDGLTCACCHTENTLWLDLDAGIVECRECGQSATVGPRSGL
ncbi:hypothetical protein [Nonomuraea typhae]|uniref:Uncharacterized protein n=1 Tax=Nonomuraea typhae TaxID=2603600 RepID=A0ABW7Z2F9_9ACTN